MNSLDFGRARDRISFSTTIVGSNPNEGTAVPGVVCRPLRNMLNKIVQTAIVLALLTTAAAAQTIDKTVRIEPLKPGENPYVYVPFDVPAGTDSITVTVAFDKSKNRLDFGLFDPAFSGSNTDKRGFRGWSAYIRDTFFVARDDASNGYQPGPIGGGTWRLVVGRAQVGADGVDLRLKVEFDLKESDARKRLEFERSKKFNFAADTFVPVPPAKSGGLNWYRGDLHVHTFHSDGFWSVRAALESARSNGLDFVAVTDHNTFSHHAEIDSLASSFPGLLIIRGEEITTYGGHINVWGLPAGGWVDFRLIPGVAASGRSIARETRDFGGLASVNHPTMACGGCSWTYDSDWSTLDSVEIWNASWDPDDEAALKIWDGFLQQGRTITAIGSSDTHQPPYEPNQYPINRRVGDPAVFIGAKSLTMNDLFAGIRAGRAFICENPRYSVKFTAGKATIGAKLPVKPTDLSLQLTNFPSDSRFELISDGKVIDSDKVGSGAVRKIRFAPMKQTYVRLEVRSKDGAMLAMTNPIYFK